MLFPCDIWYFKTHGNLEVNERYRDTLRIIQGRIFIACVNKSTEMEEKEQNINPSTYCNIRVSSHLAFTFINHTKQT